MERHTLIWISKESEKDPQELKTILESQRSSEKCKRNKAWKISRNPK